MDAEKEIYKIEEAIRKARFRHYMCDKCSKVSDKTVQRDIHTLAERMYENGVRVVDTRGK